MTIVLIITEEPKVSHAAPKPRWKNASQEQKESYKAVLEQKLESISLSNDAKDCQDVKCKKENHCIEVDHFMVDILDSIESASFQTLPVNNSNPSRKKKNVPGWSLEVKPFRDDTLFWSQIWKSAGRPINTELHKIMKRTRNIYHYQAPIRTETSLDNLFQGHELV